MGSSRTSFIHRQCRRLQIDQNLLVSMVRNALPPTAALWVIESSTLGKSFDTVGYLPIILCLLQQPIQPRVQFLKAMLVTCILTVLSACVALLAGYCSTKARLYTTPPGQSLDEYNSSAAAVSGVWLLFAVWAIQTFRVYRPQYTTSCVIATIMAIVSIGVSANLYTTAETTKFVTQMLQMFFLAHAFCTAVNLFIMPTSSRDSVFADVKNYLTLLDQTLLSQAKCIRDLQQDHSHYSSQDDTPNLDDTNEGDPSDASSPPIKSYERPETLHQLTTAMSKLHGKLRGDLAFARNDIGWSNVDGDDLETLVNHFRRVLLSLRGMSALMPLFQSLCDGRTLETIAGTSQTLIKTDSHLKKHFNNRDDRDIEEWRAIFSDLKQPTEDVHNLMQEGLHHVQISLGLDRKASLISSALFDWHPRQYGGSDVEVGDSKKPGNQGFLRHFEERIDVFHKAKGVTLRRWLERNKANNNFDEDESSENRQAKINTSDQHLSSEQEQIFVILYMQHISHHVSDVIRDLVRFADEKSVNYSSQKKRFIFPGNGRLKSLIEHLLSEQDTHEDFDNGLTQAATRSDEMSEDTAYSKRETTQNSSRRWTDVLCLLVAKVSRIVGSHQSFFGFRVACAVMSVVIVGLLGQTQKWFFNHRCLWAAVFIPFSMSYNSGETLSILLFRMIGSAWALGLAIINWYIVNGRPAGVIVFYFIFTFLEQYCVIKYPQYGGIWRPAMITRAIITGYTLQTQHSHMPSPPATTVDDYPIYLIGPYRYACTAVGVTVAFWWTVFPRSVSARSLARSKLSDTISLLGSYYNCMHSTVLMWATGTQGNPMDPNSPGRQLSQTRDRLFAQEIATLGAISGHIRFSRFEPSMGHPFRRELYTAIAKEIDTVISYMNMIVYAASSLDILPPPSSIVTTTKKSNEKPSSPSPKSYWQTHLSHAFRAADFSTHSIAVILSVLSASLSANQPLPPGLSPPHPFHLTRQIQLIDPDMLSPEHADEPGYAAFAVVEIGSSMMYEGLGGLMERVKELLGEVEFMGGSGYGISGGDLGEGEKEKKRVGKMV